MPDNVKSYLLGHINIKTRKVEYAHYSSNTSPTVNLKTTVVVVLAEISGIDYDDAIRKLRMTVAQNDHYEWIRPLLSKY